MANDARIKACLFDLGNVLLFFSHERMYAQLGEVTGLPAAGVRELLDQDRLQWRYEAGQVTTAELLARLRQAAKRPFADAAALAAASDIFRANAPMLPLLDELKRRGQRLVIVSNTNEAHIAFARSRYPLFARFDAMIFSYEVKAMKPEAAFYRAAEGAARCAVEECFFTDDVLENVEGARRHGFHAHQFSAPETLRAELRRLKIIE